MAFMKLFLVLLVILNSIRISSQNGLIPDFYKESCPLLEELVGNIVKTKVLNQPRVAAQLLRLHFHDCFVQGCDGSILLDNNGVIRSEKDANPNKNSLKGFEVIDEIKAAVEYACPLTVSCADILTIAARDSVVLRGGPTWEVSLGRRDSLTASIDDANKFIPTPNLSLDALIANFRQQGLDTKDLVALSGSHTMGVARCVSFRQRIYDNTFKENVYDRYSHYQESLSSICPKTGNDNAIAPLDFSTPTYFDNHYYINLVESQGLLHSDNVLLLEDQGGDIQQRVWAYANNRKFFFESFVESIIKMGNINVLTGLDGEIRKNCRFVNA
ncbi:peroxidase 20 [Amaranthus tricolor]|uniref:peroxidase 20 n=1 Tax=Amaranthus tricolor TaxID=29722 RepID=UPI002584A0EC|nr:peroxidase 20 [Amaranthus tricolor]